MVGPSLPSRASRPRPSGSFIIKDMKIAVIQMASGTDKAKNLRTALRLVQKARSRGAQFILLPEAFNFRGDEKRIGTNAEPIPGPSLLPLLEYAKEKRISILAGTIGEKVEGEKKVYNTSVLIDERGRIKAIYRKMHLFDVTVDGKKTGESKKCLRGKRPVLTTVRGIPTGLSICYDLRFPELYRDYSRRGALILTCPSNFTATTGKAHWEILLRSRAVENLSYVLAPNQFGIGSKGILAYGNSMIVDPWGKILARASGNREEILFATLSLGLQTRIRRSFPFLKHRKRRML